jgi:hypothetical protein
MKKTISLRPFYYFFGGRKLYYFNMLLIINVWLKYIDKWSEAFGYFTLFLYCAIVLGIEGNKVIKGKYGKEDHN